MRIFACLLILAGVGGTGCGPALARDILPPARGDSAGEGATGGVATWNDLNLTIRADRQYADLQQNRLVAEGNVRLHLAGGDLAAERVTYGRVTGLLTAVGAVRFQRGSQYIQASTLRYNLDTQEGELRDVYGVIDFDHHNADLDLRGWQDQPPSATGAMDPDAPWAELPPMACPPLRPPAGPNGPGNRVTPGQQGLVPPLGCPNPDGHAQHHQDWVPLLADEAGLDGPSAPPLQWSGPMNQRVHGITAKTGLQLEYRLAFADWGQLGDTEDEEEGEGGEDPVLPAAFRSLEQGERPSQDRGQIHRWRFQAKALLLTPEAWTSPLVVLTNDPLTPAQVILEGRDSQVRQQPDGSLVLTSARNRGLLDGTLSVPLPRRHQSQQRWFGLGCPRRPEHP